MQRSVIGHGMPVGPSRRVHIGDRRADTGATSLASGYAGERARISPSHQPGSMIQASTRDDQARVVASERESRMIRSVATDRETESRGGSERRLSLRPMRPRPVRQAWTSRALHPTGREIFLRPARGWLVSRVPEPDRSRENPRPCRTQSAYRLRESRPRVGSLPESDPLLGNADRMGSPPAATASVFAMRVPGLPRLN